MKIVVLDAATLGADLDLSPLETLGEVEVWQATPPEKVAERLAEAEVAVLNKVKLGKDNLGGCKRLKLICLAATGYDNVDTGYCRDAGIGVCNVAGYSTDSVAQLTAAMALYLTNRLGSYMGAVRDGSYTHGPTANLLAPVYHELRGMTWGIAGYGRIGKRVGEIANALGCRVLAWRRHPAPGEPCTDLDSLCRESDILSVHLPLTAETRGLFSAEKLALLKKDCIFINVARGAVADEEALAAAVREGRLGGLGVDVYSTEPFPEAHPFYAIRTLPNVCLTPHMAWGALETRQRCLREIMENIRAFRRGEKRCRVE
jgi:glycerate dehydrogenase